MLEQCSSLLLLGKYKETFLPVEEIDGVYAFSIC